MPPVPRSCSECGKSLAGKPPQTKTCSNACRLRRSRRMRRANAQIEEFQQNTNAAVGEIAAIVRNESTDVITRVMKLELAPIVREALTEDVLRAINAMVGLTPRAVQALNEDLDSEDATIRQRAYTLLIKYTVGHQALVKPDDTQGSGQMVVNFNLPRPDAVHEPNQNDTEVVDEEPVLCDMCNEPKAPHELVAGSSRCQSCFDAWRTEIAEKFA